jgi:phenylacetate-CoA ligase
MLKKIVKNSPSFIEKPARYVYMSIPDHIRYGKTYRDKYKFLKESQWWTKEKQEEYQMEQISKLLKHAYENVPYYTRVFDERGLKPKDIKNFNDLKQLPYLTKEIIRENLKDLIAVNYDKSKLKPVKTGGTSALPMDFFSDPQVDKAGEWAFISNLWQRVGYNDKKINRCVILRGDIPKNLLYEYKGRDLILSSFQMTEKNMKLYVKLIEEFNPDYIQAYPSSIYILSKYIIRNDIKIKLNKLKYIFCSSEDLHEVQRPYIQEVFGVGVYSFYGHTEHACLAGECEQSSYFHLQSEYGYTEIINELGQDVEKEDEVGEIVATGFNNYVMPFIRYKTGDLVVNTNEKCDCGRNYKLIKKIEGRKQDFFVDITGSLITSTSCHYVLSNVKDKISSYQYVQNEPGKILLNIQIIEEITWEDMEYMVKRFSYQFPKLQLKINTVDHIERTKGGKFRFVIQNLDISKQEGEPRNEGI